MISTVILPVAGLGTRFLPATKSVPKELLPVVDKPLLQYAVEEAWRAGIRHVVLVNSPKKSGLETHLQPADPELVAELTAKGKKDLLAALLGTVPEGLKVTVVMQPQALGLGHAVACGAEAALASAGDGVAVMLVDDFIDAPLSGAGAAGCLADMVALHEATGAWSLAVEEVPRDQVHRYGVVSLAGDRIVAMVENPPPMLRPAISPWSGATCCLRPSSPRSPMCSPALAAKFSSPMASARCSPSTTSAPTASPACATTAVANSATLKPIWRWPCAIPSSPRRCALGCRGFYSLYLMR